MHLTNSTRDVVFIKTSEPSQSIQLLKEKSALDEKPDSSTDIVADNLIKRYSKRPKCLENWCLADYVSQLEIVYLSDDDDITVLQDISKDDDLHLQEVFSDEQTVVILKNGIKIRRPQSHKVILYVRYNSKSDEENYFREKILLFLPWRNEATDLFGCYKTYKQHYEARK